MSGTLNMNKNEIVKLPEPIDATDAATRLFVYRTESRINQNLASTKADLSLKLTNLLIKDTNDNYKMNNKQIKDVAKPTQLNDVVTINYLEKHIEYKKNI